VNTLPFGVPTGVTATATATTQVVVTWFAMSGVDHFDVLRSSNGSAFGFVGETGGTMFIDNGVSADNTYLYVVRAVNGSGSMSANSAADAATTVIFADDPLAPGTLIKAVHITQLRTAVNAFRASAALGPASFEDSSLAGVPVRATHIQQLRDALSAAKSIMFTDATLTPGTTLIKAVHVQQLRDGVK
jgi:fibronectin type 3 domain-containing protein